MRSNLPNYQEYRSTVLNEYAGVSAGDIHLAGGASVKSVKVSGGTSFITVSHKGKRAAGKA